MILLATILFTIGAFIDKSMVGNVFSPALYKSIVFFLASLWILSFMPNKIKRIKNEFKLQKALVILVGLFLGLAMFLLMRGFQTGEASKVLPVHNLSLVFSVLAGIFLLNEKEKTGQKILGAIVAFLGLILLKSL